MIGMEGTGSGATASLSDAFDALYSREARTVLRYLRSVVREPAVAEDICGDAFCKAWDSWPRFRGTDAEARAWMIRIARNLVIDRVRRDGRLKFEVLREAGPVATAVDTPTRPLRLSTCDGRCRGWVATIATCSQCEWPVSPISRSEAFRGSRRRR